MPIINVEGSQQGFQVKKSANLLKELLKKGYYVKSPCGGKGSCKKCKVKIRLASGKEEKKVLACQYKVQEDLVVILKKKDVFTDKKSDLAGQLKVEVDHDFHFYPLTLDLTSKGGGAFISDKIEAATGRKFTPTRDLLRGIDLSKGQAYQAFLLYQGQTPLGFYESRPRLVGLALDLGTTTLALYLYDLESGEKLGRLSSTNPQSILGADVVSRLEYALKGKEAQAELSSMVYGRVNTLYQALLDKADLTHQGPEQVVLAKVAVAGNTAMMQLLLGLDPSRLAVAPYLPAYRTIKALKGSQTPLTMPDKAKVHLLANIGGYVGADTVAMLLALDFDRLKGRHLAVDLGTNGEIALLSDGQIYACSTAAGPAFEGASITFGMRADEGAIEAFYADGDDLVYQTIAHKPPLGICGSGLITAVATLLKCGLINKRGKICKEDKAGPHKDRLGHYQGQPAVRLSLKSDPEDIWLTQKDIRELQLAKGAVLSGIKILLDQAGLIADDLDRVYLAGAFGSYVDLSAALTLGLLPALNQKHIKAVGNAAGQGVIRALLSKKDRKRAEKMALRTQYVDLAGKKDFNKYFASSMSFTEERTKP